MEEVIKNINSIIDTYQSISLAEMDSIKLMNRTDTKFVFNVSQLDDIFDLARPHYKVVEIDGNRIMGYKTIYYDTYDHKLYLAHQNGKLNRYKVRQREYIDSDIRFMEVKFKSNKGRTIKERTRIKELEYVLSDGSKEFILDNMKIDPNDLEMTMINRFDRITLANTEKKERITIDLNLRYVKDTLTYDLPFLCVAEIKQEGYNNGAQFMKILKQHRIHPAGMSKYCIGVIAFNEDIKQNNFKTRLLKINKVKDELPVI